MNVPFETIIEDDWGMDHINYVGKEPQLIVVMTQNEIDKLDKMVSKEALVQVQQLDFQRYFVIALFRGVKPTSNYQTIIEHITKNDDQLIVYAQFWEPGPHTISQTIGTSPYYLVKIAKENIAPSKIKFLLHSHVVQHTP